MIKRFKNIKPRVLLAHLLVTLAYPCVRAFTAANNRLQVFTDILTIVALFLVFFGVFYSLSLHGDFDLTAYFFHRRIQEEAKKDFEAYEADKKEEREAAFNYPLFLGILYLLAAAVIAWGFY